MTITPIENQDPKRKTYLTYFKDGVSDACLWGVMDDSKRSSVYYKQGYDFGITLYCDMEERK